MDVNQIIQNIKMEDLAFIVRKVMEKHNAEYFGSSLDMDTDNEFVVVALKGNKENKYVNILKNTIREIYNKVPEKEGLDRNYLERKRTE